MEHGLFGRLPADLWYRVLRHVSQEDMLALAATCHASAEVFRNPQVPMERTALMLHAHAALLCLDVIVLGMQNSESCSSGCAHCGTVEYYCDGCVTACMWGLQPLLTGPHLAHVVHGQHL
jgi:hypothetical protein